MEKNKSYIELAYEILEKRYEENGDTSVPMPFNELLDLVLNSAELSEEEKNKKASKLYTALSVDGRFVIKENNCWVLKEKELYDNVHIDMNSVYSEVENEEKELLSEELNEGNEFIDEDEEESKETNLIDHSLDVEDEDE